jgi:hypothetical protein
MPTNQRHLQPDRPHPPTTSHEWIAAGVAYLVGALHANTQQWTSARIVALLVRVPIASGDALPVAAAPSVAGGQLNASTSSSAPAPGSGGAA